MKISTLIAILSAAGASCSDTRPGTAVSPVAGAASNAPTDLVLRTYDVPNDGAAQLRSVLKDLMWFGSGGQDNKGQAVGRADVGPDGRLVVLASEGVQEGVQALIAQMAKAPAKARPTIEVSYWFVLGTPTTAKDAARPAALGEVAAALSEIEKADGPQQFTLQEKLSVSSLTGEYASVEGRSWKVGQTASATAGGVSAELRLSTSGPQHIDTRVKLAPAQIVVLGSSGAGTPGKEDAGGSLYYLIRAAIHDGQGQ